MKAHSKNNWLALMLVGAFALVSCDKNPTSPTQPIQMPK